jgi:TfoX/Sxy family transcriptional regulator of competence genes
MFGNPVCFVNGHFFAGLHNDRFVVRLPGSLRAEFAALRGAEVFDPLGTGNRDEGLVADSRDCQ